MARRRLRPRLVRARALADVERHSARRADERSPHVLPLRRPRAGVGCRALPRDGARPRRGSGDPHPAPLPDPGRDARGGDDRAAQSSLEDRRVALVRHREKEPEERPRPHELRLVADGGRPLRDRARLLRARAPALAAIRKRRSERSHRAERARQAGRRDREPLQARGHALGAGTDRPHFLRIVADEAKALRRRDLCARTGLEDRPRELRDLHAAHGQLRSAGRLGQGGEHCEGRAHAVPEQRRAAAPPRRSRTEGAALTTPLRQARVGVVIPCFRVRDQVLSVIAGIGPEVSRIYVVDDGCPEHSGALVSERCKDPRVTVLRHEKNKGVGGAVVTGYKRGLEDGCTILVKVDGDGQMDPALIPRFLKPILAGAADYTKGNRFFELAPLRKMPAVRLFGNAGLSFVNKLSSGYWDVMDPTNGYTAIHASALRRLPLDKLAERYFFESDMLFQLGLVRAVVRDVPMQPRYAGEASSLRISRVLFSFPPKYLWRFVQRIFFMYFIRDFNVGTLEICAGVPSLLFGVGFGLWKWIEAYQTAQPTPTGTIMLATLPTLLGSQLLLSALMFDVSHVPRIPLAENDP
ncbi:MAG: glycosyltransferase family 2 protein [Deltaproteobacteria bacterium]|nr:glycosyltransferase family 2 protein [Deltaproteobacteria bacterium]